MEKRNFLSGAAWLAFFVLFFILIRLTLPEKSHMYPMVLSIAGSVLSIMLMVKHYPRMRREAASGKSSVKKTDAENKKRIMQLIALTAAYVLLLNVTGFLVSSILFVFALVRLMSRHKNLILEMSVSVFFPAMLYLIFVVAFKVSLPAGILF